MVQEKQQQHSFLLVSTIVLYFDQMIRVLCVLGMLEPTSGEVKVEGMDHRMHIQDVRKILGFCPQYGRVDTLD